MKSRQIATRLTIAFAILLAIVIAVGWLGLNRINQAYARLEQILGSQWAKVRMAQEALEQSNLNSRITTEIFLLDNADEIELKQADRAANTKRISELLARLEAQSESAQESALLAKVKQTRATYIDIYQRALHLLLDERNRAAASPIITQQGTQAMVSYHAAWAELLRFEMDPMDGAAGQTRDQFIRTRRAVFLAILLAVVLAGAIAVFVTRRMVRESAGQIRRVAAANQQLADEVEERKRAEAALEKSDAKFRRLFESNIVAVMSGNLNGQIPHANQNFLDMVGCTAHDLASGSVRWDKMVMQQDWPFWHGVIQTLQSSGIWGPEQVQILHKDGHQISVYMGLAMTDISRGDTIGFAIDLTERNHAQEALLRANQNLSTLIQASPTAIITVDRNSFVQLWNPAAERLFGWTEKELLGRALPTLPAAADKELAERVRRGYNGESTPAKELRRIRKDGTIIEISAATAPVRDAEGKVTGVMAVMEDITERKHVEEELRRARKDAEAASHAKSEFLANMSHEIRTPLNGVIGMTDLALDTKLSPEQREYLEMVKTSADSLLGVINDILDFSKIEAGKLELDSIEFNIRDLIEDTARMLGYKVRQKGLALTTHVAPEVPPVLVGDPERLRQVFFNLLGNAVKFTDYGQIVLRVEIAGTSDRPSLHFSVSDTGIGIAKERHKAIFEAFSQADSSMTRKYGGTGLGLTITSRLINLMAGRIWVESALGKGSTFHFTASFGVGKEPQVSAAPQPLREARSGLRILLAEDNRINQMVAVRLLEQRGHSVTLAANGLEALAMLESGTFDVVLMDVQMPEMDGLEATQIIREKEKSSGKHLPIIALTAHSMKGDEERCLEAGMDCYVAKPLHPTELFAAVERFQPSDGMLQHQP